MSDQIISQAGYNKLQAELNYLKTEKRMEIADRIQNAKDMGDLSENAEYSEAKDAQAFNEGRILEITQILKNLTVVESGNSSDKVSMGSKITVKVGEKEKIFTIVSFNEADPIEGKISNESPLGMAVLEKKKGDSITVDTPKGEVVYKIINIE